VLMEGMPRGTPGGVDQVEGSLICDRARRIQTIFTTTPVPLNAQGKCGFLRDIQYHSGHLHKPLFLIRIGPIFRAPTIAGSLRERCVSFGDSH